MNPPTPPLPDAAADLARNGDAVGLGALLKGGLAVDARDAKGNTLLMLASYHGRTEVVKLLLKSGATVDLRNDKGQTPLGGVAFKGYARSPPCSSTPARTRSPTKAARHRPISPSSPARPRSSPSCNHAATRPPSRPVGSAS